MHYFVRVNGFSWHVDPARPNCFVPGEPPNPVRGFNYVRYCLTNGLIRIGWPDTGDLRGEPNLKKGALSHCYELPTLKPHHQAYLRAFAGIAVGSTILMPDKDRPGEVYVGTVTKPYWYHHAIPMDPYECAHRVGVEWDRDEAGSAIVYQAGEMGIGISGGFWMRAFQVLDDIPSGRAAIPMIRRARGGKSAGDL